MYTPTTAWCEESDIVNDSERYLDSLLASLPAKALPHRDRLRGKDAVLKLKLSDGGSHRVIVRDGLIAVEAGDGPADTTVIVSSGDVPGLLQGSLNPLMAYMSGRVKVEGDMSLLMRMKELFS
jgi:putative sterol carrier protein